MPQIYWSCYSYTRSTLPTSGTPHNLPRFAPELRDAAPGGAAAQRMQQP